MRVWLWHVSPEAAPLPGRHDFGFFLRYLTFYSYTLQTIALGVATADDWRKLVRVPQSVVGVAVRAGIIKAAALWVVRATYLPAAQRYPAAQRPSAAARHWSVQDLTRMRHSLHPTLVQFTGRSTSGFTRTADDLSSAVFAFSHLVSIMFYTIQWTATKAVSLALEAMVCC